MPELDTEHLLELSGQHFPGCSLQTATGSESCNWLIFVDGDYKRCGHYRAGEPFVRTVNGSHFCLGHFVEGVDS